MESVIPEEIGPQTDAQVRTKSGCCQRIPCRYVMVVLVYAGIFWAASIRSMFTVVLVAMVNSTETGNDTSEECPVDNMTYIEKEKQGEFYWDTSVQTTMISAFFYGYMVLPLPGGFAAEKFGVKLVFGLAAVVPCFLALLFPVLTKLGPGALIAARVLQGLAQGPLYPAMYSLWGMWAPATERSTIMALIGTAFNLGSVFGETVAGALCETDFLGGWPSSFYLLGTAGILWYVIWLIFAHGSPQDHPRISTNELKLLQLSNTGETRKYISPPWRHIVTSIPMWALLATSLFDAIGFFGIQNCIPLYMRQILRFDIVQSGFLSSAPYVVSNPVALLAGFLADFAIRKGLSVTATRKILTISGQVPTALILIGVGFVDCNAALAIGLLFLSISLNMLLTAGYVINHLDLAPRYAGSLMGITTTAASAGGVLGPLVIGQLVTGTPTSLKWRNVFYVYALVYLVSMLIYTIFGTGKQQSWATDQQDFEQLDETSNDGSADRAVNITDEVKVTHSQQHINSRESPKEVPRPI